MLLFTLCKRASRGLSFGSERYGSGNSAAVRGSEMSPAGADGSGSFANRFPMFPPMGKLNRRPRYKTSGFRTQIDPISQNASSGNLFFRCALIASRLPVTCCINTSVIVAQNRFPPMGNYFELGVGQFRIGDFGMRIVILRELPATERSQPTAYSLKPRANKASSDAAPPTLFQRAQQRTPTPANHRLRVASRSSSRQASHRDHLQSLNSR
ncbi:hypothetical protein Pan181_38760 [Aeoliella mucimassa]|uniref:Uncharacterized protein n=1 Tax=Aeoliella mucimassa TaxID=2527972 RepID=A0A518ASH8_9BACT|nr:hypothetical protein Pan181_38760 [Aeoliella mucimassa]